VIEFLRLNILPQHLGDLVGGVDDRSVLRRLSPRIIASILCCMPRAASSAISLSCRLTKSAISPYFASRYPSTSSVGT
jgi:hypothetical protein